MLTPSHYWIWTEQQQQVALDMGDMLFVSALKSKKANKHWQGCEFTLEQTEQYYQAIASVEQLKLPVAKQVQASLNAVAVKHFGLAMPIKSWFYQPRCPVVEPYQFGDLVLLTSKLDEQGVYLMIGHDDVSATLLLLSPSHQLDDGKTISEFTTVCVHVNRLEKLSTSVEQMSLKLA